MFALPHILDLYIRTKQQFSMPFDSLNGQTLFQQINYLFKQVENSIDEFSLTKLKNEVSLQCY